MNTKQLMSGLALAILAVITSANSCSNTSPNADSDNQSASLVSEETQQAVVNGNSVTYGSHTYTVEGTIGLEGEDKNADGVIDNAGYQGKATAKVTFTNIPSGYAEFEAVYTALLGKSIIGTVAMIPMAMEIYARDNATGEKCVKLLCGDENSTTVIRSLQSKFKATSANNNDPYIQRYLPAALLDGAKPDNAYTPNSPYAVCMTASVNKPQKFMGNGTNSGTVNYVYILTSGGWDTAQRSVEILKRNNSELHTVFNCPSVYTQCQYIQGTWKGLQ